MKVIISYQEKAKLTLSGNIQRKQTKRHFYRPVNFKTFRGPVSDNRSDVYFILSHTHPQNKYKPFYIHCKSTRIFKKLTTFWKNMNSQDQYLKQL